jgi:hypothetical protein
MHPHPDAHLRPRPSHTRHGTRVGSHCPAARGLRARARHVSAFAEKLAAEGFAFLDARIRESGTGPVLTCRRDGKIVGAIGPMEIMPDSRGIARLLPQYLGILPGIAGSASAALSGGPPCNGASNTRPPTSYCKPRSAAHPNAYASPKD